VSRPDDRFQALHMLNNMEIGEENRAMIANRLCEEAREKPSNG